METCTPLNTSSISKTWKGYIPILGLWLLVGSSASFANAAPESCVVPPKTAPDSPDTCHCDAAAPPDSPDLPRCDGLVLPLEPAGPQSPIDISPPDPVSPPTDMTPPDMPAEAPDSPATPDTPDQPAGPETPDTPNQPAGPETPDTPVQPAGPETPDTPDQPAGPETPDSPDQPVEPDSPDQPAGPETPDSPDQPAGPVTPDSPDQPAGPVMPDSPEQPIEPTTPETPVEPGSPETPEQPSSPDAPQTPEAPVDLDTPDTTDSPAEPTTEIDTSEFLFDFSQDVVDLSKVSLPERTLQISTDAITVRVEGTNATTASSYAGGSAETTAATAFQSAAMSIDFESTDNPSAPIGDAQLNIEAELYLAEAVEPNDGDTMYLSVDFGQKDGVMQAWATLWRNNGSVRRELETQPLWSQSSDASLDAETLELGISYDDDTTVTITLGENQAVLSGDAKSDNADTRLLVKTTLASELSASGTLMATITELTLNAEPVVDLTQLFVAESNLTQANSEVSVDQGLLNLTAESLSAETTSEAVFETTELPEEHGIKSLSAVLNIDGEPASARLLTGTAYLSANLFNDTFDGDWNLLEGDVVGTVGARLDADGSWRAYASLERLGSAEGDISSTIAYYEFPGTLNTDTDYPAFIQLDDDSITFGINQLEHTVESIESRYVAWNTSTRLVADTESGQGSIAVKFDDLAYQSGPLATIVEPEGIEEPPVLIPNSGDQGNAGQAPLAPAMAYALAYSTHTVELFWSRSTSKSVTSYEIYRGGQLIADVDATSWMDYNLPPDSDVEYRVFAKSANAVKSQTPAVATTRTRAFPRHPTPPTGVKALRYSSSVVEIFWERIVATNPVIYEVERDGVLIAQGDMLSTLDINAPDDAEYFYEVFALDNMGRRSSGSGKLFFGKPAIANR